MFADSTDMPAYVFGEYHRRGHDLLRTVAAKYPCESGSF